MKKKLFLLCFCSPLLFTYSELKAQSATWLVHGNAPTSTTQFIGTTNTVDLVFKTNNTERVIIKGNTGGFRIKSLEGVGSALVMTDPLGELFRINFPNNASYVLNGNGAFVNINTLIPPILINVPALSGWTQNAGMVTLENVNANVGIGTTNPNYKLDIVGRVNIKGTLHVSDTIKAGDSTLYIVPSQNQLYTFSGPLRINTINPLAIPQNTIINGYDGFVGIGTTSPTHKLHVIGTQRVSTSLASNSGYIDLIPDGQYGRSSIELGSISSTSQIDFKGINHLFADFRGRISYSDGSGFDFFTLGDETNSRMHIGDGGAVQIASLALPGGGDRMVICSAGGTLSYQAIPTGGGVGDNLGNHIATQPLNMNNYGVYLASAFGFNNFCAFNKDINGVNFDGGNFGVGGSSDGSYRLTVYGDAYATGMWDASDIRYKKDIKPITSAIDNILKLQGTTYYFRQDEFKELHFSNTLQYGIIAQELEKVFPDMVKTDSAGFKAISYDMLVPVLIEGIKEQQSNIEEQNKKITKLEERLTKLENNSNNFNNTNSYSVNPGSAAILYQNIPNPFGEKTQIKCFIPSGISIAQISFYDLSGTLIETKTIGGSGEQIISVDGYNYNSNIYVYSLYVNNILIDSKKMVVNK